MLNLVHVVILILTGIIIFLYSNLYSKKPIPKGLKELPKTTGWPLFGVLFSFQKPLFAYLTYLSELHGSIFKITIGAQEFIVLNTYEVIEKALKNAGNNFSGRWKSFLVERFHKNAGILCQDGEKWETKRGFILKVLRNFGLGKKVSEEIVNYESTILLKEIECKCGIIVNTKDFFPLYTVNVVSKMIMNMRYERSHPDFKSMTKIMEKIAHDDDTCINILELYPIMKKIPFIGNVLLWQCGRSNDYNEIYKYIKSVISDHEKRFSPENDGEDLIDIFLKEMNMKKMKGIQDDTFTEWELTIIAYELFIAGYETTSTTLSWSMVLMARNPDIQDKVHRELKEVIGLNRLPQMADKKLLTYTQAVMDEIFRHSSVVPLSLFHKVFEDTDINRFFIPKDSIVIPNIFSVHHDKDLWENPFEFYPEHFLSEVDGVLKYVPRDDLIPFGIGKRQCLGESLARLEFFTIFTSIVQRFRIKFPKILSDEEFDRINVGTSGLIRAPINSDIVFELLS